MRSSHEPRQLDRNAGATVDQSHALYRALAVHSDPEVSAGSGPTQCPGKSRGSVRDGDCGFRRRARRCAASNARRARPAARSGRTRPRVHPRQVGRAAAALRAVPLRARAGALAGVWLSRDHRPVAHCLRQVAAPECGPTGPVARRRCRTLDLRNRSRPRVLAPQPVRCRLPQVLRRDADVDPASSPGAARAGLTVVAAAAPHATSATGRFFDSAGRLHRVHCGVADSYEDLEQLQTCFEGWDVELIQLGPRRQTGWASRVALPSRRVIRVHAGRSVVVRGTTSAVDDCLLLSLPEAAVRWLGQPISGNRFALAGRRARVDLFLPYDATLCAITTEALRPSARRIQLLTAPSE